MDIRKVVIPVAGWGTRSLPASKNIPKEMLPIYNKPVVQYVVEEAVRAGVKDVIFVTNRDKTVIEDHFDNNPQLELILERSGKLEMLQAVRQVANMVNVMAVRQKQQLGLGHAVLCAKDMIGAESFAVMVGDDIMLGANAGLEQLVKIAAERKMPVIGVMEVPAEMINRYGMVMGSEISPGVYNIEEMVEKPALGSTPARLAITGRYVLTPDIFDHLAKIKPGHGGEIQLTDALVTLSRERGMLAVKMAGIRFDAGDWIDYFCANIFMGLQDPKLSADLKTRLQAMLKA